MEYIRCPLCNHDLPKLLYYGRDLLLGHPGEFSVVECQKCDFVYLNPRPTKDEMRLYYSGPYPCHHSIKNKKIRESNFNILEKKVLQTFYGYPPIVKVSFFRKIFLFPALLYFKVIIKNHVIIPYRGEGKVLDIGCGTGELLCNLMSYGFKPFGVELDSDAACEVKAKGIPVFNGNILDKRFPATKFDIIVMQHSLEHMAKPLETLNKISTLMEKHSILFIAVPNFKSIASSWFKEFWYPLDIPRHLSHFTPVTMHKMLEKAGLTIKRYQYPIRTYFLEGSFHRFRKVKKGLWFNLVFSIFSRREFCLLISLFLFLIRNSEEIVYYVEKEV